MTQPAESLNELADTAAKIATLLETRTEQIRAARTAGAPWADIAAAAQLSRAHVINLSKVAIS